MTLTDDRTDAPLTIGYWLSSEEHDAARLVRLAVRAEAEGMRWAMISDHFHPWTAQQGQSPFVWSVLGAIAQATRELTIGTGVTCPLERTQPPVVAHAAATAALLLRGRFFLGVGSGEALNEHITGRHWRPPRERLEMLETAVGVIRALWTGTQVPRGDEPFAVEDAQVFTRPRDPVPIYVAAGGKRSAQAAGRFGDGLIATSPKASLVDAFEASGGRDKPRLAQVHLCWASDTREARQTARQFFPIAALPGALLGELRTPADFEQLAQLVTDDDIANAFVCGPDPDEHLHAIAKFAAAGYSHLFLHQVGPDQAGFFDFYRTELAPRLAPDVLSRA